jgi:hypothetical protein
MVLRNGGLDKDISDKIVKWKSHNYTHEINYSQKENKFDNPGTAPRSLCIPCCKLRIQERASSADPWVQSPALPLTSSVSMIKKPNLSELDSLCIKWKQQHQTHRSIGRIKQDATGKGFSILTLSCGHLPLVFPSSSASQSLQI